MVNVTLPAPVGTAVLSLAHTYVSDATLTVRNVSTLPQPVPPVILPCPYTWSITLA